MTHIPISPSNSNNHLPLMMITPCASPPANTGARVVSALPPRWWHARCLPQKRQEALQSATQAFGAAAHHLAAPPSAALRSGPSRAWLGPPAQRSASTSPAPCSPWDPA